MSKNIIGLTVGNGPTRATGGPTWATWDCLDWNRNTNLLNFFLHSQLYFQY